MLCQPLAGRAKGAAPKPPVSSLLESGLKYNLQANSTTSNSLENGLKDGNLKSETNNNNHKQINYEKQQPTTTTRQEASTRGRILANQLSPQNQNQNLNGVGKPAFKTKVSAAFPSSTSSSSQICTSRSNNNLTTSPGQGSHANSSQLASKMIFERRQAISMERLNSIQSIRVNFRLEREGLNTAGGSLSSGGSDSSLDENSSNGDEPPARATGLTRSASRVSRFRSAKEFFERLSSVGNNSVSHLQPLRPVERTRGSVLSRYAPAGSRSGQATGGPASLLSVGSSAASSPGSQYSSSLTNIVASSVAAATPRSRPHCQLSGQSSGSPHYFVRSASQSELSSCSYRDHTSAVCTAAKETATPTPESTCSPVMDKVISSSHKQQDKQETPDTCTEGHTDTDGSEASSRAGSPLLSRSSSSETVLFLGDNVIVNNGSLLNRRNKQLRIKFDEQSVYTFEYPSEEAMLASPDPDSPTVVQSRSPSPQETEDPDTQDQVQQASQANSKPLITSGQPKDMGVTGPSNIRNGSTLRQACGTNILAMNHSLGQQQRKSKLNVRKLASSLMVGVGSSASYDL